VPDSSAATLAARSVAPASPETRTATRPAAAGAPPEPRSATLPRVGAPRAPRAAGIAGIGAALPARVVGNAEVAARLGVAPEWIERRTGIRERRHLAPGERVSDLAAGAARAALDDAGLTAEDIDLVLVATTTADEVTPNTAPLVAGALGAGTGAIDVGAACTGFLAGLALGTAQIEAGRAEHVLLVGADALSRHLDPHDRRTAGLFGDGAGAVVLAADAGTVGPVVLRSAAGHAAHIRIPHGGTIAMAGHETFLIAVASLTEATLDACEAAGTAPGKLDRLVFHQANRRILDAVAERLGVERDRVVDAIATVGNTSAASIPLALAEARPRPGERVLLGAVGAGFTYGAAVLAWA